MEGAPSTDCSKSRVRRGRLSRTECGRADITNTRDVHLLKSGGSSGLRKQFRTCSDFPCLLRLRRVVGDPDFWSQTVTRPRGYGRFATHRDPSPATLKIVSISLEEFAAFDTCANQWCQLAAVANVELTEKRAHPIFSRPKPSGCLRRWCATVPGDHGS